MPLEIIDERFYLDGRRFTAGPRARSTAIVGPASPPLGNHPSTRFLGWTSSPAMYIIDPVHVS